MLFGRRFLQLNEVERNAMRTAGRFNAQLMDFVRAQIQPGLVTAELDKLIYEYTLDHGHAPACLGYKGFPRSCCISPNEVVCHGIPGDWRLEEGDIVNVDITTIVQVEMENGAVEGWLGDQSETFFVGEVSEEARQVTQAAFDCLYLGIDAIAPNGRIAEIGRAIVKHAHALGFGVVDQYVGHGIGRKFHQQPSIPHKPSPESYHQRIAPGVCFTIEPMINAGTARTVLDRRDGWTVRTSDRRLSAQFEHTILMTENGPEILTLTQHGPQRGHRF